MAAVAIDRVVLQEVLGRRDMLVRAITDAAASENWDAVMAAFDGLLTALAALEAALSQSPNR